MEKAELLSLVDILYKGDYINYKKLLEANSFYLYRTEIDGLIKYETYILNDGTHSILHIIEYNVNKVVIDNQWIVRY